MMSFAFFFPDLCYCTLMATTFQKSFSKIAKNWNVVVTNWRLKRVKTWQFLFF
jgi:hypothetical protein